jgi:DNA polymerase-3 subunit delta
MPHNSILQDIRNKKFSPIYTLSGEEPFFIQRIVEVAQTEIIPEEAKETALHIFFGKESNAKAIVQQARMRSLWNPQQLIIVKETQDMKGLDELTPYIEKPNPQTILILAYQGKLAKNLKITKLLQKSGVFFEAAKIPDWKLTDWVKTEIKSFNLSFAPTALLSFIENLGNDLQKMYRNFEKLQLILPAGSIITEKDIEAYIGISRVYNVFELQKALAAKNHKKTLEIISFFAIQEKDYPFPMVVGSLYNFFSKLVVYHYIKQLSELEIASELKIPPFQVKEYKQAATNYNASQTVNLISILRQYDLKSKGVGNTSNSWGELMQEMVNKMLFI